MHILGIGKTKVCFQLLTVWDSQVSLLLNIPGRLVRRASLSLQMNTDFFVLRQWFKPLTEEFWTTQRLVAKSKFAFSYKVNFTPLSSLVPLLVNPWLYKFGYRCIPCTLKEDKFCGLEAMMCLLLRSLVVLRYSVDRLFATSLELLRSFSPRTVNHMYFRALRVRETEHRLFCAKKLSAPSCHAWVLCHPQIRVSRI